jgi:hypothetical protein
MAIVPIQIGKNFVEYVLLDGGSTITIMIDELQCKLDLPLPKLAPYNFFKG